MERTVVGLFDDVSNAQRAVEELLDNGFNRQDISVVRTDQPARPTASPAPAPGITQSGPISDRAAEQPAAAGTGAGIGAVLGGIAGLVVGLGALAIPGIGPIVAAGPLAAALAGAGVGAATGGIIGALTDVGIPKNEAELYAEGIRSGDTLVTVRTSESEYGNAMLILNRHSPVDMNARATQRRPAGSTSANTNQNPYTNVYARRFEDLESEFRKDWETRYSNRGYDYERYRPAYQYGWQAYSLFGSRHWKAIEPELEADWLRGHPSDVWADFRDAVQMGWETCKSGAAAVDPNGGEM